VRGIDLDRVGKRHQLVVQRVVHHPGHGLGRGVGAAGQVRPSDVADEQRVAGEDEAWLRGGGGIRDHDAEALGRVARRLQDAQDHAAHSQLVAVPHRLVREQRARLRADDDGRARALGQLQVAAHEVGVQVGLDDVADGQAGRGGLVQVLLHVAARVHDRRLALVADEVGRLGQAAQIELLEVHGRRRPLEGPAASLSRFRLSFLIRPPPPRYA
jgi:hypothetical protein